MTQPQSQISKPIPRWGKTIKSRIEWVKYMLEKYPKLYPRFKNFASQWAVKHPHKRLSSELIIGLMRSTGGNTDEDYDVNSNLKSLFARFYKADYPSSDFDMRKCWLDDLTPDEWTEILESHGQAQKILLS
jgi:hypothetical protein